MHALRSVSWIDPVRVRIHLEGVDDRDAAERLQGAYVDWDPDALPAKLCDSFDEFFGAEVQLQGSEEALGRIWSIRDNGAHPLLVIGEEELLVPCVPEFVEPPRIEGERKIVTLQPIPGLLEANR